MRFIFFLFIVFFSLASLARAEQSPLLDLILTTEDYAPMNYEENGQLKGISIDLLHAIWKKEGIATAPEVALYPWARGYFDLQKRPNFVLFAVARIPSREKLFHWACPVVDAQYILLARKSSNIQIESVADLSQYTIGTIRSDVSEQALLSVLSQPFNILSNTRIQANLELLDKGRIQVIAYDKAGAQNMLRNAGRDPDNFVNVFTIAHSQTCFAFNKVTDMAIIEKFRAHLKQIVDSGEHQKIVDRYMNLFE